jgi:hypothetical protein
MRSSISSSTSSSTSTLYTTSLPYTIMFCGSNDIKLVPVAKKQRRRLSTTTMARRAHPIFADYVEFYGSSDHYTMPTGYSGAGAGYDPLAEAGIRYSGDRSHPHAILRDGCTHTHRMSSGGATGGLNRAHLSRPSVTSFGDSSSGHVSRAIRMKDS